MIYLVIVHQVYYDPIFHDRIDRGVGNSLSGPRARTGSVSQMINIAAKQLEEIKAKCEQYWNKRHVGDTEYHAALEFIHKRAMVLLIANDSTYNAADDPEIRAALQRAVNGDA